jgi:AcrR family transcriptional regulator
MTPDLEETDGRRRRGLDSRDRIVEAMLELMREGEVAPGAERVAARADVGLRTVFRHFRDMDSLYAEISRTIQGELADLVARPLASAEESGRLVELASMRAEAYERIFPFKHASMAHRHRSDFLASDHARMVANLRQSSGDPFEAASREPSDAGQSNLSSKYSESRSVTFVPTAEEVEEVAATFTASESDVRKLFLFPSERAMAAALRAVMLRDGDHIEARDGFAEVDWGQDGISNEIHRLKQM